EGRGTEAITLYEAGIEHAEGIIAGTDDDANNLSIIMTARDMNKNLFTVARQNLSNNDGIFAAANIDLIMKSGTIIGRRILDLITNPLLNDFLRLARTQNEQWANVLVSRVAGILTDQAPETWTLTISDQVTPALQEAFRRDQKVTLCHLITDPREVAQQLPCVLLYLKRADQSELLLPKDDTVLQTGDRLLFCGRRHAETHMLWTVNNPHALNFICTGFDRPSGAVWRLFSGIARTERHHPPNGM
ncbi:MAG: NAD-binding protein, partial [Gammaproteobacteria bacterium]